jgi:hypothetical protein
MKRSVFALLCMTAGVAAPSLASDVGVSVSVGQPGFYGRIDVGDFPQPQLVYAQPVIVQRVAAAPGPVYLVVPPGHAKHWDKHCAHYQACGRPVYFVQQSWYNDVYVPRYQERHRKGSDEHHDNDQGEGHGKDHGEGHEHD